MDQNPEAVGMAFAGGIAVIALIIAAIAMIPLIFYCLTLQKALNRCSPESRAMQPGMVWLMLIPLFNIIWHFLVVLNMAKSLGAEFKKRGMAEEDQPGKTIGLVACILACCGVIPVVNYFSGIAFLVCWIIYWVKIAGFSGKIAGPAAPAA